MAATSSSPGTSTVHYAEVGPVRLAYETFGDPADPALLLVMGQGAQMLAWPDPWCEELAAQGLHVVRFDNRDAGLSTHLSGYAPYDLDDLAADTVGLLDALGIGQAHVVGISMGAMIGQLVAVQHPERVLSLTCIASSTGSRRVGRPRASLLRRLPIRRRAADRDEAGELFARVLGAIGSPAYPADPAHLRDLGSRAYDRAFDPRGGLRQLSAIVRAPDRTPGLRSLRIPVLVVHGDADPLVASTGGRAIADAVPGATFVTVLGMGHDLPRQVWPLLTEQVLALARRTDAPAAAAQSQSTGGAATPPDSRS
ncbi:MAG TPA: alpha/beta hydrolase [Actinomycetales bacterium]|jgi:pimeloyl-ACP methyl ester carboxylesterase